MVVRETRNLLSVLTDSNCWTSTNTKNDKKIDFLDNPVSLQYDKLTARGQALIAKYPPTSWLAETSVWPSDEIWRRNYLSVYPLWMSRGKIKLSVVHMITAAARWSLRRSERIPPQKTAVKSEWTSNYRSQSYTVGAFEGDVLTGSTCCSVSRRHTVVSLEIFFSFLSCVNPGHQASPPRLRHRVVRCKRHRRCLFKYPLRHPITSCRPKTAPRVFCTNSTL